MTFAHGLAASLCGRSRPPPRLHRFPSDSQSKTNLHLLFWLSLIPFATTWIGENPLSPWPVALYGVVLLMAGLAYFVLTKELIAHQRAGSMLGHIDRARPERRRVDSRLCGRHSLGIRKAVDRLCVLRLGCTDVADSRPTHRENAGQQRVTGVPTCRPAREKRPLGRGLAFLP